MLELYRRNGYRLRASQTHREGFHLSPTRIESFLRDDGYKIEVVKPTVEEGNPRDNWHVMTHDPNNPNHGKEGGAHKHKFSVVKELASGAVALFCPCGAQY